MDNVISSTLTVPTNDDDKVEDTETIELTLTGVSQPSTYTRLSGVSISSTASSHTVTISNEDDVGKYHVYY